VSSILTKKFEEKGIESGTSIDNTGDRFRNLVYP
jgi:hypothetical protein